MALTERIEIGSMNVLADGQVQVRTDTIIEKDGVEISRAFHRHVEEPDGDPDRKLVPIPEAEHQRKKDLLAIVHTPEVKANYIAARALRESQAPGA